MDIGWLQQFGALAREAAIIGLLVTGAVLILVRDWRLTLLALLGQYVLAGVVLSQMVLPEVALIKTLIGALICPMLYLAARQSGWGFLSSPDVLARMPGTGYAGQSAPPVFRTGLAFRLLAATLVLVLAVVISQTHLLAAMPADVALGCTWLILAGLLVLMLTEEPLKAGPGLLAVITGFELVYTPLETSLAVVLMWAFVNLLLAVAISYLAAVRGGNTGDGDL
jgi:hypothetical protein